MPRRGWSSIATPSGWYEVIRGPRPPSVQWPLASKGKGKGKGKQPSPVEGGPSRSCIAGSGARAVNREDSVRGSLQGGEGRCPEASAPATANCRSVRTSRKTRSRSTNVGEDDPDAERLNSEEGKGSGSSAPSRRASRFLPPVHRTSEQTSGPCRRPRPSSQRSPFANELRDLKVLRAEASEQPRQCPGSTCPGMELETNEEISKLRAQVAELQMERQSVQEAESSRSKKARTLGSISTDLSLLQGGVSAHNPSDVMMTLIDAADSTLRQAGRGVP